MTDEPRVTMRVEQILAAANGEAARLHHEYIGTEHLLLALSSDDQGVAVAALKNLGINLNEVRARVSARNTCCSACWTRRQISPHMSSGLWVFAQTKPVWRWLGSWGLQPGDWPNTTQAARLRWRAA